MKIKLSEERRKVLLDQVKRKYSEDFDQALSDFKANALLEFLIETVGGAVYNQAVEDVRGHLQKKLDDLNGEVYADGGFSI